MFLYPQNWLKTIPTVKLTFQRFPLAVICALLATTLKLTLLGFSILVPFISNNDIFLALIIGVLAFTNLTLLAESKQWPLKTRIISTIPVILLIALIIFQTFTKHYWFSNVFYTFIYSTLLLALLFFPFVNKAQDSNSFWYFNYRTFIAIFFAAVSAIVFAGGISLILVSISYLFEIKIESYWYYFAWTISWGILFVFYVLANIDNIFSYPDESCDFPKGVNFITNYIFVPLMATYTVILYAYFLKILIQWELPRGNLVWMIAAFGGIGIVTKLLIYPIRSKGTRLLRLFDLYFHYALIIPLIVLILSISIRIQQYGLTESRYAVILFAVWMVSIIIYSHQAKDDIKIKFIPLSLAILTLFAAISPWNATTLSYQSQSKKLSLLLEKYNLIENGQVIKNDIDIPFEDLKSLSSVLDYLARNKYHAIRIEKLFAALQENQDEKTAYHYYGGGRNLMSLMGLRYVSRWDKKIYGKSFTYSYYNSKYTLLPVTDFDYILTHKVTAFDKRPQAYKFSVIEENKPSNKLIVFKENGKFAIKINEGHILHFDISQHVQKLWDKNIRTITLENINNFILTSTTQDKTFFAKLMLEYIHGQVAEKDKLTIKSFNYRLLIRQTN